MPWTDTYIEKDSSSTTTSTACATQRPRRCSPGATCLVASVSCIYGIGSPEDYSELVLFLSVARRIRGRSSCGSSSTSCTSATTTCSAAAAFECGATSSTPACERGDGLPVEPLRRRGGAIRTSTRDRGGTRGPTSSPCSRPPITHTSVRSSPAIARVKGRAGRALRCFEADGRMLEAHRLRQRTDSTSRCCARSASAGIENYSRHLDGRKPGTRGHSLIDFFPDDYLIFVDESHVAVPQIGGMFEGDRRASRPSWSTASASRGPSTTGRCASTSSWSARTVLFVSATPGAFELRNWTVVAEMVVRPTGLVDPQVRSPTRRQIDDLLAEVGGGGGPPRARDDADQEGSEDLTDYLLEYGVWRAICTRRWTRWSGSRCCAT